jgi:predicted CxxxxCH...CXXCH cytochrome family protein
MVRPRTPLNTPYGSYSSTSLTDCLPSQAATHTFGTCTNTYCHSTVQADGGVDAPVSGSPVWGTYLSECNSTCHGVGDHGEAAPITSGSHSRHLAYSFKQTGTKLVKRCPTCHLWNPAPSAASTDCAGCHSTGLRPPEIFARHVNGSIDISFNPNFTTGAYNGTATPVAKAPRSGYSACSSTYCHSNGSSVATGTIPSNTSPTWGSGPLACNSCHGNPPSYGNGSPKKNSHAKHDSYGYSCSRCHYATTSDGTTIADTTKHVNLAYTIAAPPGAFINYSFARTGGTCLSNSCHNDGTGIVTGLSLIHI